jgi:hypothetical protein
MNPITHVGEIHVDVQYLKDRSATEFSQRDALIKHLIHYQKLCMYNRRIYTEYARIAKMHNDLSSLTALGVSTVLGIISSLGDAQIYRYVSMGLSGYLALISGMQRFLAFAEKSENARLIAKGFDKIERDIGQAIMYVNSHAVKIDSRTFTKHIEEIQRNIAAVSEQAIQSPPEWKSPSSSWKSRSPPSPEEEPRTRLNELFRKANSQHFERNAIRMSRNNSPAQSDVDDEADEERPEPRTELTQTQ